VEKQSAYNIAFKGLKEGNHVYDYPIGKAFFEPIENSLVEEAKVDVAITLEKRNTFMSLSINLQGTIKLLCDRCLEFYDQPVKNTARLFIKFSETGTDDSDEVIWLHPDAYQINVAQIIYEYICLSIPLKHVHPVQKNGTSLCDPEMLKTLKAYVHPHEEKQDERWDQLKNLMSNN
jgi:uncharacterized protein